MTKSNDEAMDRGSFKDPAGYVFFKNKKVYRKVARGFEYIFNELVRSGLYKDLTEMGLLLEATPTKQAGQITLEVSKIPFISYPY